MSARLARLSLVVAALALAAAPAARGGDAPSRPAHVVLVVLGGGVRSKEMLDPATMPNVVAIGARGVVVDRLATAARSPHAATTSLLTGRGDVAEDASRPRPSHPTLLECVRRDLALAPERAWFVAQGGEADARLAASDRPEYGAAVAPAVAFGDGAFGEPLGELLSVWGHPIPTEERTWVLLRGLRVRSRAAVATWLPEEVDTGSAESERTERALLAELDRRSLLAGGAAPEDDRTVRAALTVLRVHRPVLCVVRLEGAARGQASVDAYRAALAADDAAIGRLRAVLDADPALATTTALWVVADMGRNAAVDEKGRLAADDDSADRREVALVAEGPGLRRGAKPKGPRAVADVAPTLARLLGASMPEASGTPWEALLDAPRAGN